MPQSDYQLIFVVGASGSGTTMLVRILGNTANSAALGGNHISIPKTDGAARALVEQFNQASARLWDRQAEAAAAAAAGREMVGLIEQIREMPAYRQISHIIYKRSFPFFNGDRFRPDLADLFQLFKNVRLVVIYRDPRASTVSSLRRKFNDNLRSCAVVIEDQLTYMAAQLATLPPASYLKLGYEDFCARPDFWVERVAEFCGLPGAQLAQAGQAENINQERTEAWAQDLSRAEVDFLNRFFDDRRRRQWQLLAEAE